MWFRSRSESFEPLAGRKSNGASNARRRSARRRSSAGVAWRTVGPTRTHTRPLYRTGGSRAGCTVTTATRQPSSTRSCTSTEGRGSSRPSSRRFARFFSRSSVMSIPAQDPSSCAPTKSTPGALLPGRSLANAQMFFRTFSAVLLDHDSVRSTRSDSSPDIIAASSASVYPLDVTLAG